MLALFLDTETTDKVDGEVIELAWFPYASPHERNVTRYRPAAPMAWGAVATHHILPSDLENCPPSAMAHEAVPSAGYWVGHNIDFDWKALGSPPGVRRIDTLAFSRSIFPELDSHTLVAMTYFFQGMNDATRKKVKGAHSAHDDCVMAWELLKSICEREKWDITDIPKLWQRSEDARIPRVWTFGKFKGEPIAAADRGYANWCRRQPDFDPYVLEALKRAGL